MSEEVPPEHFEHIGTYLLPEARKLFARFDGAGVRFFTSGSVNVNPATAHYGGFGGGSSLDVMIHPEDRASAHRIHVELFGSGEA